MSAILFRIFFIALCVQSCLGQDDALSNGLVGWVDGPTLPYARGTLGIITSCTFTLFVCFWSIQHPNLEKFTKTRAEEAEDKYQQSQGVVAANIETTMKTLGLGRMTKSPTVCKIARSFAFRITTIYMGVCGPEFLLGWAFMEWRHAGRLRDQANKELWPDKQTQQEKKWTPTHLWRGFCAIMRGFLQQLWPDKSQTQQEKKWTRTHGFCAIMRGFSVQHGLGKDADERTWERTDLRTEDGDLLYEMRHISKEKIMDKSKADWVVKGLACLQISWFVLQQSARAQQRLPISLLELATSAYVLCTLLAYFFYWDKPTNMCTPYVLHAGLTEEQLLKMISNPTTLENIKRENENASRTRTQVHGLPQDQDTSYDGCRLPRATFESSRSHATNYTETWSESPTTSFLPHGQRSDPHDPAKEPPMPFIPTEWEFLPLVLRDQHPSRDFDKLPAQPYRDEVGYWVCFTYLIGSAFGAIHVIPVVLHASFHFPTVWELWVWRLGTCICAGTPLFFLIVRWVRNPLLRKGGWEKEYGWDLVTERQALALNIRVAFWLCGVFRFAIAVLLFTSFKMQPVELYEAVEWLRYYPHF